ncbi:MAG: RagB/SusD family nutrient uptake outer membrane protein [Sphingobacterium sp.]|uniref:RagB/SusD family nutrient uptake outer membrane protein n=1 Tax=Sphingobacterium sp. JB170 TaxID=1434842 RepID=UPI00097E7C21|nr:RagB/SusD family nutrient uptake outer membrane protein [Sphingobacterium sp. JB170]SJN48897.1 putative outer membrane protein, probably involved in nutrient binding [Sphingobacterium sp. JB170]
MRRILIILSIASILSVSSCVELDITPKNIVTDDDLLNTPAGMDIYIARMYSHMPFEDFKYMAQWGLEYNGWLASLGIDGTGEAVNRDGITTSFTGERTAYWGQAFELIRDANHLIEMLPNYQEEFASELYDHYLGEAYYVRATVFYALARRFGGIPLVTSVIQYPAEAAQMEVPRASEEETWDQVLADFDRAAALMQEKSPKKGYSNKYVALAFKSQAMLYAGSVAKYNQTVSGRLTGLGEKTNVRVIGFENDSWQQASNRYFLEAYKAAREVMSAGGYSLYKKRWQAGDKGAQYQNMIDMFSDLSSPENIYVKEYLYPTLTHGLDSYSSPFTFRSPLSAGTCPTLDFIELFDGFPRYPDGSIRVTTGNSNTQGTYVMYDDPMAFFEDAEPRLRAYVIFPGDEFRGQQIEVRGGIYTGGTPIKPLFTNYAYNNADTRYQNLPAYTQSPKTLYLSPRDGGGQEQVEYQGQQMLAAGENGPFYDNPEATLTGLYLRKWLQTSSTADIGEGKSSQPFILMRYAEVLLNAAEAAVELQAAGVPSPDGSDMLQVATEAINEIRERAGAVLLDAPLTVSIEDRNVVRKERRKELAFEHKTKWDLRRWRVLHYEGRDGFWGEERPKETYSNNENFRFRGLYPFFSTEDGKYFFDARFQWVSSKTFGYTPLDYYFSIPSGEVAKSSVIDQQPNR